MTPPSFASVFAVKATAFGTESKMRPSPPSESRSHSHPSKRTVCSSAAPCQTPGLDPDPKARFFFSIGSRDFCPFPLHPRSHPGCSFYDSARTTPSNTSLCCDVTGDFPPRLCCLHRSQSCHRNPCCCFRIRCGIQIMKIRGKEHEQK